MQAPHARSLLILSLLLAGPVATEVGDGAPPSPWMDLGFAFGGILPFDPHLEGTGPLTPNSDVTLTLTDGVQGVFAFLIIGVDRIDHPFAGGTLVPSPDLIVRFITNDGTGGVVAAGRWPPGVPSGFTTYFQFWIQDGAGPFGFVASNAISGTTP